MKILTLENLVKFCEEKKLYNFDAKDSDGYIVVSVPARFESADDEDSTMLFANIAAFHTGDNRNGSSVTEQAAKECMKTMAYKPLLANFCEIDGVRDFTSHDTIINDDGEEEYLERQIGCFTADKPYMQDDETHEGRKYIWAKVAIPREYTDAADIIERKGGTDCSVELAVYKMSYSVKDKVLLLESVEMLGCTCLGTNPETGKPVKPGMEGAHVQLEDFSVKNNSIHYELNDEIKKFIKDTIKESFDDIATNNQVEAQEGGKKMADFDENVEVTETEEVETTSTEESAEEVTVTEAEEVEEVTPDVDTKESVEEDVSEEAENYSVSVSLDMNGEKKEFSISLNDKINALYTLVNDTYSESDNDFYGVDVYDEEKYVVMHGYFTDKHYRQDYSVKKDVFSLKGDRVAVYAQFLTEDEMKKLDEIKSNYSSISEKLQKYEDEPAKIEILQSDDYSDISETEDFKEFSKREAYFDMSVDEVKSKCDAMLLEAAKAHKVDFSAKEKPTVGVRKLNAIKTGNKKGQQYGRLLEGI